MHSADELEKCVRVTPPSVWVALAAFAVLHAVQLPIPQCRQDGFGLVLPKLANVVHLRYERGEAVVEGQEKTLAESRGP